MTLTLRFLIVIWTLSVLFKSLIKKPTCYKNPEKPTCIDLILTNSPRQFQATLTLETGLSDFHKMAVATFKSEFPHQKPKIISCRNYKHFDRNNFEKEIKNTLIIQKISPEDFSVFKIIILKALNLHANQIFTGKPLKFYK